MRFLGVPPFRIEGIHCVVPSNESSFVSEVHNYEADAARSLKLAEVMGYGSHRLAPPGTTSSRLAVEALRRVERDAGIDLQTIDALVLVTQSPDYFIPPTSFVVHSELGLRPHVLCVDLVQGCAGFVVGLMHSAALMHSHGLGRVALVNVDVLSQRTSPRDRNSFPLIGDAASVTLLTPEPTGADPVAAVSYDSRGWPALCIPAGAFAIPSGEFTRVPVQDPDGNWRSPEDLRMDGAAVFAFVQAEVPTLVEAVLNQAHLSIDDVDLFAFHQPNRFMLRKLAHRLKIPVERMPMNVVARFGNSSGATIPMAVVSEASTRVKAEPLTVLFAGFGVGLTRAAMLYRGHAFDFASMSEY